MYQRKGSVRPRVATDFQRARVEKWETDCVDTKFKKRLSIQELIHTVDCCYGAVAPHMELPMVIVTPLKNCMGDADIVNNIIRIGTANPFPNIAAHEAAHLICPEPDFHGAGFMRCYMDLLHIVLGMDMDYLEDTAWGYGLIFSRWNTFELGA